MIYLDTSALAAIYFPEAASAAVAAALRGRRDPTISILTTVELASVAGIKIRTGQVSEAEARQALAEFREEVNAGEYRRLRIRTRHYRYARRRIIRFDTALRTLDALHLATAALAGAELLTLDRALARSAEAAGITVIVPT